MGYSGWESDCDGLRNASPKVVADEARPRDAEHVQELDKPARVAGDADVTGPRRIAAAEAEKIEHDDAMAGGKQRHELRPQMGRRGEAVDEHNGHSRAPCAGGVVVHARAREIEELTSHAGALAWLSGYICEMTRGKLLQPGPVRYG